MTDNYADLMSEARKLQERAVDLQLEYLANRDRDTDDPYTLTTDESRDSYYRLLDENRPAVEKEMADIPSLFEPLAHMPNPASFKSMATTMATALPPLAGPSGHADFTDGHAYGPYDAYDKLAICPDLVEAWSGDAAQAFRLNWLPSLERVVWNEFSCVAALHGTLLALHDHWEQARQDASDIIDSANSALDVYEDGKGGAVSMLLGVAATIVGVVAVPFTGGTSAALAWSCAGAALSIAGTVAGAPDKVTPPKFSADSPAGVIDNVRKGIADFKVQLLNNEVFVGQRLSAVQSHISGLVYTGTVAKGQEPPTPSDDRRDNRFKHSSSAAAEYTLPRPDLADTTPDNLNTRSGLGEPTR